MPSDAVVDARLHAARLLWQQGQDEPAQCVIEGVLAADPAHAAAAMLLGRILQGQGRLNAACNVVANQCRAAGLTAPATGDAIQFIQHCQRQRLAAALCDEALAQGHPGAELRVLAGNLARELGRFDVARAHYLAALAAGVDLERWYVLGALAAIQRYDTPAHEDFARLAAHFRDTGYSARSRATAGLGLAKACDDVGDHAAAADALREANRLLRQAQPWSPEAWSGWLADRLRTMPAPAQGSPDPDFVPIFIVGLPRSGTTLLASRLAGHELVRDRGEPCLLDVIDRRLRGLGRGRDAAALREAAALYRTHAVQDDSRARWYIDKDPNNFRYLDLVATLFPQARIIHCRRGRPDTALSVWSQGFARPHYAFANDLGHIADFFAGHDRLMEHWRRHLPLPIHQVDYEAMVADPASTLAELRRFVGIEAPAAPAALPSTAIASASLWQARQPIYATSVGRWKHYAAHVPELHGFA